MLWDKRHNNDDDDLPPELRGKSKADVIAALKKAEELAAKAEEIEAARVGAEKIAADSKVEIDAMKAKIAELEASRVQDPPPPPDEPPSPWIDPEKFVTDRTKGTHGIALTAGLMAAKMYFMQNLSARDAKIHKKYEKEVEQMVGTAQPEQRVMPQTWWNMFLYVKGLHESDIGKAEQSQTDFFSEVPSRGISEPEPQGDKLTAEEEEVCRTMHWDPKGYLKQKQAMTMSQSSKGAYARFTAPTTTNRS